MSHLTKRRDFLAGLGRSGAALAAGSWLGGRGYAQTRGPGRVVLQAARHRADMDRRLLGAFLEHLGRAIYTGVYEPGSPLADASGWLEGYRRVWEGNFRQLDAVLDELKAQESKPGHAKR